MEQQLKEMFTRLVWDKNEINFYQNIHLRNLQVLKDILRGDAPYSKMGDLISLVSLIPNSNAALLVTMLLSEETRKEYIDLLSKIDIEQCTKETTRLRKTTYTTLLTYGILMGGVEQIVSKLVDDYLERKSMGVGNSETYVSPTTLEGIVEGYLNIYKGGHSSLVQCLSYSDTEIIHSLICENYFTEKTIQKLLSVPELDLRNVPVKFVSTFSDLIKKNYMKVITTHYGTQKYAGYYSRSYMLDKIKEKNVRLTKECVEFISSNKHLFDSFEVLSVFIIDDYETFNLLDEDLLEGFKSLSGQVNIAKFIREEKDFEKLARIMNNYLIPDFIRASIDVIKANPSLLRVYGHKIFPTENYYLEIAFENMNIIKEHFKLKDFLNTI
jgi:hypothetical protein